MAAWLWKVSYVCSGVRSLHRDDLHVHKNLSSACILSQPTAPLSSFHRKFLRSLVPLTSPSPVYILPLLHLLAPAPSYLHSWSSKLFEALESGGVPGRTAEPLRPEFCSPMLFEKPCEPAVGFLRTGRQKWCSLIPSSLFVRYWLSKASSMSSWVSFSGVSGVRKHGGGELLRIPHMD